MNLVGFEIKVPNGFIVGDARGHCGIVRSQKPCVGADLSKFVYILSDNYCQEFVAKNVAAEYGISDHTAETVKMGDKTIEIVPAVDWLCQR